MAQSSRGRRQREAYSSFERAIEALLDGDLQRCVQAAERAKKYDVAGLYGESLGQLLVIATSLDGGISAAAMAVAVRELENSLGPHPLAFRLREMWP